MSPAINNPSLLGRKPKAGQFKGVCKLPAPVLWDDLTPEQRDIVEELKIRGYRKAKRQAPDESMVDVPCRFETDDPDAWTAHHKTVHGRAIDRRVWSGRYADEAPHRTAPAWKSPKLAEGGAPFKDRDGVTQTCPRCGLINQVGWSQAAERWWTEHLYLCAEPKLVNCIQVGHTYGPHPERPHCMNPHPVAS